MGDPTALPSATARATRWRQLTSQEFDLLVVGGGITGAGVAALAAGRGLKVALVEREDFGSGTSGATSKMLHGGLRYLQQGNTRLVREALHERGKLLRSLGEQRVRRTPFLLPLRGSWGHRTKLRFGTWLYQRLSGEYALGPRKVLSTEEVRAKVPSLQVDGVRGGVLYEEGVVDDVLLTIWRVGEASIRGAVVLNHTEAREPLLTDGKVRGAKVRDLLSGADGEVRARTVINAAGVAVGGWAGGDRTPALRPSKGVHLVFRRSRLPLDVAVVLPAPEGRWVFALPYGPLSIVGTTDTDDPGKDPTKVRAEPEDVRYLLEVATSNFPSLRLSASDVVDVYAGLRPLLAGGAGTTSELSREDVVHVDPSGLLSVAGGKLTTHRAMAERALGTTGLPGGASPSRPESPQTPATWDFPPRWEGTPCPGAQVLDQALSSPSTEWSGSLGPWVRAGVEATGAATLADLLDRRFHGLRSLDPLFPQLVDAVAREAAPLLGWSPDVLARQREDYLARVRWRTEAVVTVRQARAP